MEKEEKQGFRSERHIPEQDAASMNRAVEGAVREPSLIDFAIVQILNLKFPPYNVDIFPYAKDCLSTWQCKVGCESRYESSKPLLSACAKRGVGEDR